MSRRAVLLFIGLGFAWGIPYLLIKVAVSDISPAQLVLARTSLAALVLLPVAIVRGAIAPVLRRWRILVIFAVVEIAIPWLMLGRAEQQLPSSTTGLLVATVPLAGLAVAYVSGRAERLTPSGWLGLLVGLAGVAALVGFDLGGGTWQAIVEVAVTVVGYAVGPAVLARFLSDLPAIGVIALALSLTALIYVPAVVLGGGALGNVMHAKVIASVVVLALVCTAAAFLMLFALVGEVGPVRATTITYVNPAVAVVAGAVVLGEPVTVVTVVGFAMVIAGSYLVNRRPRMPKAGQIAEPGAVRVGPDPESESRRSAASPA